MGYRDILVEISNTRPAKLRAATAALLASRMRARLTGVFLKSDFVSRFGDGGALGFMPPGVVETLMEDHAKSVAEASSAARKILAQAAEDAGIAFEWLEIDGDRPGALTACARCFDLTILPSVVAPSHGQNETPAAEVAMGSGGPVLILPDAGFEPNFGKRVTVAWKSSRESARALRDALPILESADEVFVVTVADAWSDDHLKAHFERLGLKAKFIVERQTGTPPSDLLRLQTGKTGSDLMVMGLYGQPRLQELVLGGVSRDLLHNHALPLLVSH